MKNTKHPTPTQVRLGMAGLAIFFVILFSLLSRINKPNNSNAAQPPAIDSTYIYVPKKHDEQTKSVEIHYENALTATTLNAIYEQNEVLADNLLKGKRVVVVGKITRIQKDFTNQPYVTFATGEYFQEVQCYVDENTAMNLGKGQTVGLLGHCEGMIMQIVQVYDCTLYTGKIKWFYKN